MSSLRSTAAMVLGSSRNSQESIPQVNSSIRLIASEMSRNALLKSLKGTHCLTDRTFADTILERAGRHQIHFGPQYVCEAVLQAHPVQQ